LGISLVGLSQGIPFFTAGDDMLRSKSFDKDSYDSGDWFNRMDFTYTDNGFGSGLPIADKNQDNWPLQAPLLGNPDLKPTQENILAAVAHFQETLQIRKSSPLFRLQTADEIMARLTFQNTGPDQIPGLIVMTLADEDDTGVPAGDLDPNYDRIVVLFNAAPDEVTFSLADAAGLELHLHPIQAASADPVAQTASFDPATGAFTVPGRTTAVFVLDEIPVQLDLPTSEPAATRVPTSTPAEESTVPETGLSGNAIGLIALGVLAVLFAIAAWVRARRGKK
jgi:pullulanase/glycogen debranching enzyme